jgi:hypothetical protein
MSALDIAPPMAPGQEAEKAGFFTKLFRKKESEPVMKEDLSTFGKEEFDLDDIRKKLGLHEELPKDDLQEMDVPEPPLPDAVPESMPVPHESDEPVHQAAPESPAPETPESVPETPESVRETPESVRETPEPTPGPAPELEPHPEPKSATELSELDSSGEETHSPLEQNAEMPLSSEESMPPVEMAPPEPTREEKTETFDSFENTWDAGIEQKEGSLDSSWTEHPEPSGSDEETHWSAPTSSKTVEENPSSEASTENTWTEPADSGLPDLDDETVETEPAQEAPLPGFDVEEPSDEPVEGVDFGDVAHKHLKEIAEEHEKLDNALESIVTPEEEIPDHPLEKKAPEGEEFRMSDGTILKNLRDLIDKMEGIDEETLRHHVDLEKNDFANWLHHVLEEEQLAEKVRSKLAKEELVAVLQAHEAKIEERLKEEESKLDELLQARSEKVDKASELNEQLDELKKQLDEKQHQIEDKKLLVTEEVNERLAQEVGLRLKEEKKELQKEQKAAEQMKLQYEKKLQVMAVAFEKKYEKRETRLVEKEEKAKAKQQSLKKLEKNFMEEKKKFEEEKKAAAVMIEKANALETEREAFEKEKVKQLEAIDKEREKLQKEKEHFQEEKEKVAADKRSANAKAASTARQEKSLETKKEKLEKDLAALKDEKESLKNEKDSFKNEKSEFEKRVKDFKAEEKKTLAKIDAEHKDVMKRLKKAEEMEAKAEEKLRERRKIAQYIEEAEKGFEEHFSQEQSESFNKYLGTKLKSMRESPEVPPVENIRNLKIYTMIDRARESLENNDVQDARHLYNKIRQSFAKEKLTSGEKSVLYNTIRELYDDIHLASLK